MVFLKNCKVRQKFSRERVKLFQRLRHWESSPKGKTMEVHDILSTLDTTKAARIDGISPRILRHCASSLLTPICHLFISSITTGNIPTEWCTHCIIPIHKSGNKTLVNNYRPISLLCILSKVLERIVYNRIMSFINNTFSYYSSIWLSSGEVSTPTTDSFHRETI